MTTEYPVKMIHVSDEGALGTGLSFGINSLMPF
jgi:hypothetical protein